jgi:hypothetical protein
MSLSIETIRLRADELRSQFLDRYGKDLVVTDRLKILMVVATAALILSAFLGLSSFVDELDAQYTRSQIALERLKEQIDSSSWEDRQSQSQVLKSNLQNKLWTAQTPGLAEAEFERWLRRNLSQHGMEPRQLQIRRVPVSTQTDIDEDPLADVQRMTVKILMPFNQSGLIGFLGNVSTSDKVIVVDRLIARSGRNPRIEMDVSAFYRSQTTNTSGEAR